MPSPKWKLVVDIGDVEETIPLATASTTQAQEQTQQVQSGNKEMNDFSLLTAEAGPTPAIQTSFDTAKKDPRVDQIIALLGEFMPTDPHSAASNYLSGFMSLRLLLLRPTRSLEEEELIRTILDSFTSYSAGGRARSDIAMMLARDFIFLSQQQASFLGYGSGLMAGNGPASSGLSVFGLPSTNSSLQNSPALTPIPAPGIIDALSIVST